MTERSSRSIATSISSRSAGGVAKKALTGIASSGSRPETQIAEQSTFAGVESMRSTGIAASIAPTSL